MSQKGSSDQPSGVLQAEQGEGDDGDEEGEGGEEEEEKTKDKEQGEPNVAGREQVAFRYNIFLHHAPCP